ncbi:MAG: hypothetical protein ACE5KX_02880 [Acidimicrobiia bacterium]
MALVVAAALLPAGCGEEVREFTPLEAYFDQLGSIGRDLDGQSDALVDEIGDQFNVGDDAPLEEVVAAQRAFLDGSARILEDGIRAAAALAPPPEVSDAHREFLRTATDFLGLFSILSERMARVQSFEELEALFEDPGPEFEEASGRFGQACSRLEEIAVVNGIDADLDCGG